MITRKNNWLINPFSLIFLCPAIERYWARLLGAAVLLLSVALPAGAQEPGGGGGYRGGYRRGGAGGTGRRGNS